MKRKNDRPLAAALAAASGLALAPWFGPTPAFSLEVELADKAVDPTTGSFPSRVEAEAFLSRAVPAATEANPKYRTPGADYWRRWLTKSVAFRDSEGGVVVSTSETFEDYRDGAPSGAGTHQAEFAIDDVRVSLETADDVAESGEKAQGVIFTCVGAPCVHAVWDGKTSLAASTDIYLQNAAQRERILAAFQALGRKGDPP